jgi:hypothetical protein
MQLMTNALSAELQREQLQGEHVSHSVGSIVID